ncbi:hypothetical protein BC830DRAFT_223952 [Chytriomyces sp. MP71]|nr:hypothetical protein BC830DRAFT_223952 [Chytriomyces sp. MP71]
MSEAHIRSLEHSNALLRDTIAAMQQESRREHVLAAQVAALQAEKEAQASRIAGLEVHLEDLRELYVSMAAERSVSRASGRDSGRASVSRGRRGSSARSSLSRVLVVHEEEQEFVKPLTPVLNLENSSLSDGMSEVSLHGTGEAGKEVAHGEMVDRAASVASQEMDNREPVSDVEWEQVFGAEEEMKETGGNVLA